MKLDMMEGCRCVNHTIPRAWIREVGESVSAKVCQTDSPGSHPDSTAQLQGQRLNVVLHQR